MSVRGKGISVRQHWLLSTGSLRDHAHADVMKEGEIIKDLKDLKKEAL